MRNLILIAAVAGLALCGCSALRYEPDDGMVERDGIEAAQRRFRGVVSRSFNPETTAVTFSEDRVTLELKHGMRAMADAVFVYAKVGAIVAYENSRVIVHGDRRGIRHHVNFRKNEDAVEFAKVFHALRFHATGEAIEKKHLFPKKWWRKRARERKKEGR